MPPKIKQQTNITPEFVHAMLGLYSDWLTLNKAIIVKGRGSTADRLRITAKRLLYIVRQQSPDLRNGFEYELTRLRRMPYSGFWVEMDVNPQDRDGDDIPWLIGRTHHITMTMWTNRNKIMGEMGCYDVCIPSTIVQYPNMGHIHMIPLRNANSQSRHPHHGAYTNTGSRGPRSWQTQNCWGSYSGVIKGLIDEPDIPELFRQLHNHLCTYGDRPPFALRMDFPINVKE